MDFSLILHNFLSPPILFYFLGIGAFLLRSDLEIPSTLGKFFSLYLLMAIGLKGGFALQHSASGGSVFTTLSAAVIMATLTPLLAFFMLRKWINAYNAAAIAATYGSISAVTFITAVAFLEKIGTSFDGYMVAAMALMESPAIIVGVFLANKYGGSSKYESIEWKPLLQDAFLNGSVVLILGSLLIGYLADIEYEAALKPFTTDLFKGMLCFFLLDMGLASARRIKILRKTAKLAVSFGIGFALFSGLLGLGLAYFLGLSAGNALLFTLLCGSASYIAVPAAMRIAVPQANASLYVPMSLTITFPFNITIGIPLYYFIIQQIW